MISECALMAQVGEVLQHVGTLNQAIGDLLIAVANGDRPDLDMTDIRELVHRLVSVGGAVTELGVALGVRANDVVRGDESR